MKKAFCEPGNTDFCPPIVVSCALSFGFDGQSAGTLTVNRAEDNGGDVTYTSRAEIEKDFISGTLHPGDLKSCATAVAMSTLEKIAEGIKKDCDGTKASKALKAFQKKMQKAGKK
jgi:tyrosyl-tRNA synthetase